MHENVKLDMENRKLRDTNEQNKSLMEEMKKVQQQLVQKNLPPSDRQILDDVHAVHTDIQIYEKDQHIRELEARLSQLNRDNEMLRAEVDEADWWIYDRGPIQQELQDLREGNVRNTAEINRLTRENANISEDLRTAERMLHGVHRKHPRHEIGHPPLTEEEQRKDRLAQIPERASITQTFVNNMFQKSQKASRQNIIKMPENPQDAE